MAKNNMMQMAGIALVVLVIAVIVLYKPQGPDQSAASPPIVSSQTPTGPSAQGSLKLAETDIVMDGYAYDIDFTLTNTKSSPQQFLMGIRCTDLVGSAAEKEKLNTGRYIRFDTKPVLDIAAGASANSVLHLTMDDDAPTTDYTCTVQASASSGNSVETYATADFKIKIPAMG